MFVHFWVKQPAGNGVNAHFLIVGTVSRKTRLTRSVVYEDLSLYTAKSRLLTAELNRMSQED